MLNFFFGFVFGTLGVYVMKEGKKQLSFIKMGIGVTMLIYPYFVENPILCFLIGAALFGASFLNFG